MLGAGACAALAAVTVQYLGTIAMCVVLAPIAGHVWGGGSREVLRHPAQGKQGSSLLALSAAVQLWPDSIIRVSIILG